MMERPFEIEPGAMWRKAVALKSKGAIRKLMLHFVVTEIHDKYTSTTVSK